MNSKHQSCWFNLRFLPSLSITCGMELLLLNHKTTVHRERQLEEHLFKVHGHSIQGIFFTKKYTMTKIKSLLQIMTTQLDRIILIYKRTLFCDCSVFLSYCEILNHERQYLFKFPIVLKCKKKKQPQVKPFSNSHGRLIKNLQ